MADPNVGKVEAEAQDEIDQIMREIHALQQGIADAPKMVVAAPATPAAAPAPVQAVAPELPTAEPEVAPPSAPPQVEAAAALATAAAEVAAAIAPTETELDTYNAEPAPAANAELTGDPVESLLNELGAEESVIGSGSGTGEESSLEETLGSMKGEDTENGLMSEKNINTQSQQEETWTADSLSGDEPIAQPVPLPISRGNRGGDKSAGSLSMTLTGSMTLNLRYEFDGQEVMVGFSESFMRIQLADGTEFKIPVGRKEGRKAA